VEHDWPCDVGWFSEVVDKMVLGLRIEIGMKVKVELLVW